MATMTVKNIPDSVYRKLKRQAVNHHRSLNQEVIACLERSTGSTVFDPATILADARELRKQGKGPVLTDTRLRRLKASGRP
jgi:plasmid stability protein